MGDTDNEKERQSLEEEMIGYVLDEAASGLLDTVATIKDSGITSSDMEVSVNPGSHNELIVDSRADTGLNSHLAKKFTALERMKHRDLLKRAEAGKLNDEELCRLSNFEARYAKEDKEGWEQENQVIRSDNQVEDGSSNTELKSNPNDQDHSAILHTSGSSEDRSSDCSLTSLMCAGTHNSSKEREKEKSKIRSIIKQAEESEKEPKKISDILNDTLKQCLHQGTSNLVKNKKEYSNKTVRQFQSNEKDSNNQSILAREATKDSSRECVAQKTLESIDLKLNQVTDTLHTMHKKIPSSNISVEILKTLDDTYRCVREIGMNYDAIVGSLQSIQDVLKEMKFKYVPYGSKMPVGKLTKEEEQIWETANEELRFIYVSKTQFYEARSLCDNSLELGQWFLANGGYMEDIQEYYQNDDPHFIELLHMLDRNLSDRVRKLKTIPTDKLISRQDFSTKYPEVSNIEPAWKKATNDDDPVTSQDSDDNQSDKSDRDSVSEDGGKEMEYSTKLTLTDTEEEKEVEKPPLKPLIRKGILRKTDKVSKKPGLDTTSISLSKFSTMKNVL
ncbi:hypothetical protein [Strepsipteran arli-related virus OKIAV104]|uniref:Uncharacterized protein n=1 Tax=Strepsipteran arli-related virus OKIAV104 TaxID=2746355 RepID=A0AAE7IH68_9MONO|nr:hypothetical protein QKS54_gp2 [Strepsipteran arli-related virus OKIAV104]QMP82289.1 hypothetical protein [Strepsipteran arli-related virus OKIAV104]